MANHDPSGNDPRGADSSSERLAGVEAPGGGVSSHAAGGHEAGHAAGGHEAGHGRAPQFSSESLFALSPDAIVVTDAEGVIRAANPRAAELFGYGADELVGTKVEALVPARFRGRHPAHRENYNGAPADSADGRGA